MQSARATQLVVSPSAGVLLGQQTSVVPQSSGPSQACRFVQLAPDAAQA